MPVAGLHATEALSSGMQSRWHSARSRVRTHVLRHRLQVQLMGLAAVMIASAGCATSGLMLSSAQSFLSNSRAQLAQSRADAVVQTARLERLAAQRDFISRIVSKGLSQSQWSERKLNVKQVMMGRDAAQTVMGELARSRARVFIADQFDLAVSNKDEDLFTPPPSSNSEVVLTVRGRLFSRETER